ncbi:tricalbin [Dendrothele bispora CBS 962.96]|uniref:Tricalbin n=1 Tax=Dendrothele bispora (strain CBS 962.96) TaxID=1314807 RepID=A0A4S8MSM5_DENBC|nr:tricalbin [Dendrothele bispora CBS 962.96]
MDVVADTSNGQAQTASAVHDSSNGRVDRGPLNPGDHTEDRAAAELKGRQQLEQLKGAAKKAKSPAEREVQIDRGHSHVVPTISIEDVDSDKTKPPPQQEDSPPLPAVEDDTPSPPGNIPSSEAPLIPDWYKIGWRQVSGVDDPPLPEGEEKDLNILSQFLSEQFYGEWYHNAAIIVFAVFTSHFLTRFGFGWGWLFILLAVCNTYYSTSMERVRRRSRDDIQRELVKTRLASEHESADWINNFLDRFWLIYEPVLSATISSSVNQILSTSTPPFLDSLSLATFTLGNKAPRIDKVRTFPKTEEDIVMMDWGISFTPNDVSDLTPRQAAGKVNPKIALSIRVGKGLATAAMPVLVEDITFSGLMRIRMKLMTNFPHVQIVDICFLEKPVIDYVLKPIGGETFGFDIANIPGLSSFIRDMTHATLEPMMYDPHVFTLNLEQLLSGTPLDTAIGVLQVTIISARGIKAQKIGGGTPDPFVAITINNRAELAHTKYKHNTYNPTWMETKFVLVNSLSESLVLNLYDYNDHRKDTLLGSATFELEKLTQDATWEGVVSPLLTDGKERGELRYDVAFYPVLKPEGGEEIPDTNVGIVRLVVHQAKELDVKKSLSGDINPLAKVYLGDNKAPIHQTRNIKHTNSPVWESAHEFLCADKESSVITLKVIDDRDFLKDPTIGHMSIKLKDLLTFKADGKDWFTLSDCQSGRVRLSAEWKPLNMAGSLQGADQYTPPIGVVRLLLDKAIDVKNVEGALGGKSDPYVRVQINNVTKGRTEVVNNNLNPVWDQIVYIPVHSLRETLMLECMDYQHLTKDRSLGYVELKVSDLVNENDDPLNPYVSTGAKNMAEPIRLNKGNETKGTLHCRAEFVPAIKLKNLKFNETGSSPLKGTTPPDSDEGGSIISTTSNSSMEDDGPVHNGVTINGPTKKGHTRNAKSTDTTKTTGTVETNVTNQTKDSKAEEVDNDPGHVMSKEELLSHQSGIIIFNVISGNLVKKARLEVLLDDGYWPCFSTQRPSSSKAQWAYVGEGFVKELDFGQVWLRLNEADDGDKDDIIAQWKGDAKAFLDLTLEGPQTYTLTDQDDKSASTVRIEARYVPVPVQLEPRESVNNQGTLHVQLVDAHDLPAADRGGKSDPYALFTLNDQKIYKSETVKKTVSPTWNESFDCSVPSRVHASFNIEIFDWNQIEQSKSLGSAQIDLTDLEPFMAAERTLSLSSSKYGEKGQVRVRMTFRPEIIIKTRSKTSTFSSAGRAMTQLGGLPVTAGKGVFHGVTGVFKGRGGKDDEVEVPAVPEVPAGQASHPLTAKSEGVGNAPFPSSTSIEGLPPSNEPGTLRVAVLGAHDLSPSDVKPYAVLRLGDKEFKTKHAGKTNSPEWNESFTFAASALTPKMYVWVHDHRTLGKDKLLADGEVDLWRHIAPDKANAAEVSVELHNGTGLLRIQLDFDPTLSPLSRPSTSSSSERVTRTMSMASPSRFSLRGRRPGASSEDD